MYEPILPDAVPDATHVPSAIEAAGAAYRAAGLTDARSVTVVYAPASVTHHHAAPLAVPPASGAAVRTLNTPATPPVMPRPARRRFTRAELCFHVGMAIAGTSAAAVALSIVAGDASLLLAAPVVVGCATILGSAAAINREESHRPAP